MSTPNPLVPEGSLQQSKGKSNVKIAVFTILAIHAVLLVGLLMQGCKEKPKPTSLVEESSLSNSIPDSTTAAVPTLGAPTDTVPSATVQDPVPATAVTPLPATTSVTTTVTPVAPLSNTPVTAPTYVNDAGAAAKEYVIASGDTLGKVAKENHISLKALLEANPSINPTKLQIGQKIQIPGATTTASATPGVDANATADTAATTEGVYVVKAGDVLERIAKTHGTSVKAIKTANNLKTDRLKVGQKLKLPAAKTTATAAVEVPVAAASPLATTPLTTSTTVASATR